MGKCAQGTCKSKAASAEGDSACKNAGELNLKFGTECEPPPPSGDEELCNGDDDNCDDDVDEGCGLHPENSCYDRTGGPVDLATGNMFFGPIELASLPTPTGARLEVSLSYNSRKVTAGALGLGWTMNLEQEARPGSPDFIYLDGTGGAAAFERPRQVAADDRLPQSFPDALFVARARNGANLGLYLALATEKVCDALGRCAQAVTTQPRVAFEDGSRAEFTEAGKLTGFVDRFGTARRLDRDGSGLPAKLSQGPRAVELQYTRDSGGRVTGATVALEVGSASTDVARAILDSDGYLTDICSIGQAGTPNNNCTWPAEASSPCSQVGERSLWRFRYQKVCPPSGCEPVRFLSEVMDETCAVVERHEYDWVEKVGVVVTSTATATESLDLRFFANPVAPFGVAAVEVTQALSPANPPPGSLQPALIGPSVRMVDKGANRVRDVSGSCGCGPAMERKWVRDEFRAPRVSTFKSAELETSYSRAPGTGTSLDPYGLGLVTRESRTDLSAFASGSKVFTYAYQHPTVRRPTVVVEPRAGGTSKQTVHDYYDDDAAHPCADGVAPQVGSPLLPNEKPTRFLCRTAEMADALEPSTWRVTHFKYDSSGRVLRVEGPSGVVENEYYPDSDPDALRAGMLKRTSRLGGAVPLATTFSDYHFTGQPQRVTGANGEVTLFEYDERGRVVKLTAPDGAVTLTSYEANSKPSAVVLPRGNSIHFAYGTGAEDFGRLMEVAWHEGATRQTPLVQRRRLVYDRGGNVLLEEHFEGISSTPVRRIQRDYDEAHRVVRELGADLADKRENSYKDGRLSRVVDELGRRTDFFYDGFGRLRRVSAPLGAVTAYGYDARDNLTSVTDANGNVTTYSFDNFDQLLSVASPNTGRTSYRYTLEGLLAEVVDAEASKKLQSVETTYDGLRRPAAQKLVQYVKVPVICPPGATCEPLLRRVSEKGLIDFGYDVGGNALGRLTSVESSAGKVAYTYDAAGRLQKETWALSGLSSPLELDYAYHPGGALESLAYPPQSPGEPRFFLEADLGFDEQVSELRLGGKVLAQGVAHYPFGGGVKRFSRGNGLATDIGQDLLGRRKSVQGAPVDMDYTLFADGEVGSLVESGDVARKRTYKVDDLRRLTTASYTAPGVTAQLLTETYNYDLAGNRLLKTRGFKKFSSVFDLKAGTQTPANDLLRQVVDPSPAEEECRGPGAKTEPDGGGGKTAGQGNGNGGGNGKGKGAELDGGTGAGQGKSSSSCPGMKGERNRNLAGVEAGWKEVVRAARQLLFDLPGLSEAEVYSRTQAILEGLSKWMEEYEISGPALQMVLLSTRQGKESFADVFFEFLGRRAEGKPLGKEDLKLLQTLVNLAEKAQVRAAGELDPTWGYFYDGAGNVVETRHWLPGLMGDFGPIVPPMEMTYCLGHDELGRLSKVKLVLRMGTEISKPTSPCEETGTQLAEYRYDYLNRRVYSKVAGKEVFSLYGPSGELLAEASASGVVERLFAYLEGEPLAMVVTKEGTALRPSAGPQPGCSAAGAGYTALAICLALVFIALRRRTGRGAVLSALLLLAVLASTCGPVEGVKPHGNGSAKTKPGRGASLKDPLYFFHNDRLGTPVRLTDEKGAVVWRAEYRPFGDLHQLKTDPDGDGVHIEQPLRFPGQYDEALWGLVALAGPYYNWHRWYSPDVGRYLQVEPYLRRADAVLVAGLHGRGMPAYAYAENAPTLHTDPSGLSTLQKCVQYPGACPPPPTSYTTTTTVARTRSLWELIQDFIDICFGAAAVVEEAVPPPGAICRNTGSHYERQACASG